jgi:ABC transport system ATP-binding/permease protein
VPVLTASTLTKSFGPHSVLDGVDLSIHQGERVGLVGRNGSGKSTLAKILAGEETADTGELSLRRGARVMYLAQEPALDAERSALETVLAGLSSWWAAKQRHDQASAELSRGENMTSALTAQSEAQAELERHGGFDVSHRALAVLSALSVGEPDKLVGTMSGGERRRVALARLLVAEPELAILDEPTNHLDIDAIEWLETHLADQYRGAVLLISHDRYFLDGVVDRTLEVEAGKLYGYQGGFADYLRGKAERMALAERTEQNRQNFLRKELDWLSRSPPARTTKQQARIERAQEAIGNRPAAQVKKLDLALATASGGKSILDLENVGIDAPDGGRPLISGLTLHLTQGERIGVLGKNGAGKSTLLRAILGEHPLREGRLTRGKNAKIAYLSQHRSGLDEDKSILDNVAEGRSYVSVAGKEVHAMTYLESFLFRGPEVRKPVKALSGGERTRVALAKLLRQETSLLLLDEPTNDLDLDTLAALESLLLEHDVTAIVVTHDRWFLDRIATSILWFQGEERVVRFVGNYSNVAGQREALAREQSDAARARSLVREAAAPAPPAKKKAGLSYKEQKELDQIESVIAACDARVSELEALLADPALYQTRRDDVPALRGELDEKRAESERLMNRWAELEEKRGG